jgi:hypothetical protein
VTLPVLLLGIAGMLRALRARAWRRWMLLPLGHAAAMLGAVVLLGAGLQPRYFILIATVAAAYAGAAIAGVFARDRIAGFAVAALGIVLLIATPGWFPSESELWVRRDPELRALVDAVHARSSGHDIVWVADDADYLYACRWRPAFGTYHALPRADSDPAALLVELESKPSALAVVQQTDLPVRRWARFAELAAGRWQFELLFEQSGYRIYGLQHTP